MHLVVSIYTKSVSFSKGVSIWWGWGMGRAQTCWKKILLIYLGFILLDEPTFHISASREFSGAFSYDGLNIENSFMTFPNIVYTPEMWFGPNFRSFDCLIGRVDNAIENIEAIPEDCNEKHLIICQKVVVSGLDCFSKSYVETHTYFDWMSNPELKYKKRLAIEQKKAQIRDMSQRLNQTLAFKAVFSTLWYAPTSCFEVPGITGVFSSFS